MGRKKVVTTEETEGEEVELLVPSPGFAPDPESIADVDVIEELKTLAGDDGIKWIVHKISTRPGEKGGWCAEYQTGELSLAGIRDTFGGGRYKIQGRRISGGQVVTQRTLEIVETPKPGNVAASPGLDVAALATALKPGDNGVAAMMPLLLKMMETQSANMVAMMGAIAGGNKSNQPSFAELLTLVKAMQPERSKDGTELLLEGLKLGREMAGGGGETGMLDIAAKGLDLIAPALKAQAAQPKALPRPAPVALPPPAAAPPAETPTPPVAAQPTGENPMLQKLNWLRHQTNILCYQAQKGGDPELYAAVLLDNLPPFITEDEIYERISAPDAVAQLSALDARVSANAAWFEQFRQAIIDSFSDDTDPNDEAGNADPNNEIA